MVIFLHDAGARRTDPPFVVELLAASIAAPGADAPRAVGHDPRGGS